LGALLKLRRGHEGLRRGAAGNGAGRCRFLDTSLAELKPAEVTELAARANGVVPSVPAPAALRLDKRGRRCARRRAEVAQRRRCRSGQSVCEAARGGFARKAVLVRLAQLMMPRPVLASPTANAF